MPSKYRNIDYTDRELLIAIWSISGRHGATSNEIAQRLGIVQIGRSRVARIVPRLTWMRRFGFLLRTQNSNNESVWSLTEAGEQLMHGKLALGIHNSLQHMNPGSQLLLMRELSQRSYVHGSPQLAHAIRREWEHQRAKRSKSG